MVNLIVNLVGVTDMEQISKAHFRVCQGHDLGDSTWCLTPSSLTLLPLLAASHTL